MAPTFETGEYLIVDQVSYRFENPTRGDVIIFRFPNDPSKYFIKRIIGLPGEVVELANGYTTIVNPSTDERTPLDEEYLVTDRTDDHLSISLASDEYFVMGDNRSASSDSRMWGPVPRKNIIGKALIRLLPPREFGVYPGAYTYTTPLLNFTNVSE
jgi:signal peptidase I